MNTKRNSLSTLCCCAMMFLAVGLSSTPKRADAGLMFSMRSETPTSGSADATITISADGMGTSNTLAAYDVTLDIVEFDLAGFGSPVEISGFTPINTFTPIFAGAQPAFVTGGPAGDIFVADGNPFAPLMITNSVDLFSFDVTIRATSTEFVTVVFDSARFTPSGSPAFPNLPMDGGTSAGVTVFSDSAGSSAIIPEPSSVAFFSMFCLFSMLPRWRSR